MPAPPTGKVVFLFTDIEGSTRAWEAYPELMREALARHDTLLRRVIEANGGYVFKTIGDAFCAVFPDALSALKSALAGQRALFAERWEVPGGIRVRMALHLGETVERAGDYFGPPVNRVARLLSAGHGGQILISRAVEEALRGRLPPGVSLRDLGERSLKDLVQPERIFQVVSPELPQDFPPLRTLDSRPNNLPAQPTPLVGREREVAEAQRLLLRDDVRLLTFTGAGGTGKTRLALQVAAEMIDDFDAGIFFVPLAAVQDPALLVPAVAQALEVREEPGRSLFESLAAHIGDRKLLLLLDNMEQLLAGATVVTDLLAACPRCKVLATSRAALRVYGEHEYPVEPLAVPERGRRFSVEALARFPAVALFVQRAEAVRPGFLLTPENAPAVAEICARLDGLPLAIELAAARVKLFPPQSLLPRLTSRLQLLTGGARDLPQRHRTLRNTIAWSYELLDESDRRLWRRLSVFSGGCTLEAAEAVCNADGAFPDLLDRMASLVDHSLLRQEPTAQDEPRFTMLQTLQEFGRECLAASGEEGRILRLHAEWFLALAEQGAAELTGPAQREWLDRLEREHDNLRAALERLVQEREPQLALRLGAALWRFWSVRGYLTEGRARLEGALQAAGEEPTPERARALVGAGVLASEQGDWAGATAAFEEARRLAECLGDGRLLAEALNNLGLVAFDQGRYAAAREHFERCLELSRELRDRRGIANALNNLGRIARRQGDHARARALYEESLALLRQLGDRQGIANTLMNLGNIALDHGELTEARKLFRESLEIRRELGAKWGIAASLNALGNVAKCEGDYAASRALYEESLEILRELGDRQGVAAALGNLGEVAQAMSDDEAARAYLEESLAIDRELGNRLGIAYSLGSLAELLIRQGEFRRAREQLWEVLALLEELGDTWGSLLALEQLAAAEAGLGRPERALRLAGAARALRRSLGAPRPPSLAAVLEERLEPARRAAGERAAALLDEGERLSLEEAIRLARAEP